MNEKVTHAEEEEPHTHQERKARQFSRLELILELILEKYSRVTIATLEFIEPAFSVAFFSFFFLFYW